MADYVKINAVDAANIVKINGVDVGSVAECNGLSAPSASGATQWVARTEDGLACYASNSDLTSWTGFISFDALGGSIGAGDTDFVGFGRDANGNGIYMSANKDPGGNRHEMSVSGTDITTQDKWTTVDINSNSNNNHEIMCVMWGARSDGTAAGTWMAVGDMNPRSIFRSVDGGANWSTIDLSTLTGTVTADYINGIASDGQGRWMCMQDNRIYYSTDDGATFSVSTPFSTNVPGRAHFIVYTNQSWVVCYSRSSVVRFRSCAASDITDWGDEVDGIGMAHNTNNDFTVKMAAANGNVVAVSEADVDINRFTVSGKTIGTVSRKILTDDIAGISVVASIATDGNTWVVGCRDGDAAKSTDNGANWTQIVDAFEPVNNAGTVDWEGITANVVLPL